MEKECNSLETECRQSGQVGFFHLSRLLYISKRCKLSFQNLVYKLSRVQKCIIHYQAPFICMQVCLFYNKLCVCVCRTKAEMEQESVVDGNLATETSLIVLDTLEIIVKVKSALSILLAFILFFYLLFFLVLHKCWIKFKYVCVCMVDGGYV